MTLGELRAQRNGGGMTLGELRQSRLPNQSLPKEEIGTWDYLTGGHALDDLAIGTGQFLGNIADMTERALRPENMTPSGYIM